ncbi:hypothetical protein EDC04DRAFT_2610613 [Pisolithus marmoratus]|nr:hypothetical protein EDC04DRAFT_2610613 [Pisolithus marmoratus]
MLSYLPELHIEQGDEPDHGQSIDFGEPDQGQLWDLFKNGLMGMVPLQISCHALTTMIMLGDLPTDDEHRDLQHAGLANTDTKDDGSFARKRMAADIQQLVINQVKFMQVGQYTMDMIDLLEGLQIECAVIHLLAMLRVSDWPTQWFDNLCLDLDDIWNIPLGTFQMIDSLDHHIPEWMPRMPNKYAGFIFPWWLHGASKYPTDFQKLRGRRIYPIADEYFQYKWPAKNSSMGDQIDGWIKGKVHTYMTHLQDIAEQIELNKWDLNHLCSQWAALTRLLGMDRVRCCDVAIIKLFNRISEVYCGKMLLWVTCDGDHELDSKPAVSHMFSKSNTMLPKEISLWFQDIFIPTLLAYCGMVPNPWNLPHPLQDIIADLWPVVFPQIPYDEQQCGPGTPIFLVACQCLYDWCSKFAEMGEKMAAAWFESDEFMDDESHAVWADWAIDEEFGLPFVFKYLKLSNNKGVGAFHAPLLLQTMAFHCMKTANAIPCLQIDTYLHGALTLATVAAISMWAGAGSLQTKWGISSASYVLSIGKLSGTAWEEIESGALEYAKIGRRFKAITPSLSEDAHACIMDCNSDEDSTGNLSRDDDGPQEHIVDQPESNWENQAYDNRDIPTPPSLILPTASHTSVMNHHLTSSEFPPFQAQLSPNPITDNCTATVDSVTHPFSITPHIDDPYMTSSGLRYSQFLSGLLTMIVADRDVEH